jgi:hypothetical protein
MFYFELTVWVYLCGCNEMKDMETIRAFLIKNYAVGDKNNNPF